MKNTRLYLGLILVLSLVFITACSDDKDEQEQLPDLELIAHSEIVGVYEVKDSQSSAVSNGDIWSIKVETVNIGCTQYQTYSYKDNSLAVGNYTYEFTRMENKENYKVSYKDGANKVSFTLVKTESECEEQEEEVPTEGDVELDKLYGYAEGVTGGEGGKVHHFDTGTKFRTWLALREKSKSKDPAVVWLSGAFTKDDGRDSGSPWFDIKDTENITIYGTNSFKMKNVGLFLVRSKNIIIRNVYIEMPKADNGADGISMQKSEKIWVDHCTFESINQTKDYEDGSCDVTHATKNVTVSWNHFLKTQKTALVGHSNSETGDNAITVTFHHNFFDKSSSRHPRVRFGKAHVYNNFYNGVTTYGAGSAYNAKVLLESNYFDGVHLPTDICTFPAKKSGNNWVSNLTGTVAGFLYEANNFYINKPSNSSDPYPFINVEFKAYGGEKLAAPLTRDDFVPSYEYVVTSAEKVKDVVQAGAGVGKLPNFETAPIAVDNGGITGGEEPGTEEPEEPAEGIDLGNDWIGLNIGAANGSASVISDGNGVSISGTGKFESGTQSFFYAYREIAGDFVVTARVDMFATTGNSNQAQGGLMFTPDVTKAANEFFHAGGGLGGSKVLDENGAIVPAYYYTHRLENKVASKGTLTAPTAIGGDTYIKLQRVGDKYIVSYSLDGGVTYGKERNGTFAAALPNTISVGFYISGGNGLSSAKFSDIKINGSSIGFVD